jgi:hypothetical protein
MARIFFVALTLALSAACTPSQMVQDYSRYSGCPEDKLEVSGGGYVVSSRYRVSGCGNGADYVCTGNDECASPMITVARRHAKQFGCSTDFITVEELDGGIWRASGCNHALTYVCYKVPDYVVRCVAETEENPRVRQNASEQ